uniref:Uncharacterized protein n=1 Tax=Arundo donax TaxID=35708 RepID=A0A0A9END1_ARUDO
MIATEPCFETSSAYLKPATPLPITTKSKYFVVSSCKHEKVEALMALNLCLTCWWERVADFATMN